MEKHNHAHALFPIPVKPHVKDYLIFLYGCEPIPAHLNSYIGNMVGMLVGRAAYKFLKKRPETSPEETYIHIRVPKKLRHCIFGEEKRRMLGDALNKFFVEQFMASCVSAIKSGTSEQKAVEDFLFLYKVSPEHWDLDAARKCYRDNRDKRLIPLIPEWIGSAPFSDGEKAEAA